jgi:hypothetical protein
LKNGSYIGNAIQNTVNSAAYMEEPIKSDCTLHASLDELQKEIEETFAFLGLNPVTPMPLIDTPSSGTILGNGLEQAINRITVMLANVKAIKSNVISVHQTIGANVVTHQR